MPVFFIHQAARIEAERTAGMKAKAGRASYVSDDLLTRPDAGATGCAIWMSAISQIYSPSQ
jgi:DAK2 domain